MVALIKQTKKIYPLTKTHKTRIIINSLRFIYIIIKQIIHKPNYKDKSYRRFKDRNYRRNNNFPNNRINHNQRAPKNNRRANNNNRTKYNKAPNMINNAILSNNKIFKKMNNYLRNNSQAN